MDALSYVRPMAVYALFSVAREMGIPRPDVALYLRDLPDFYPNQDSYFDEDEQSWIAGHFMIRTKKTSHIYLYNNDQPLDDRWQRTIVHELVHWAEWRLTGKNGGYGKAARRFSWAERHAEQLACRIAQDWDIRD